MGKKSKIDYFNRLEKEEEFKLNRELEKIEIQKQYRMKIGLKIKEQIQKEIKYLISIFNR